MIKFLEQLYFGNINPSEEEVLDPTIEEIIEGLLKSEEQLDHELPEELREAFFYYRDSRQKYQEATNARAYEEGFRNGTQLMLETINQK